jgi:hypothetical protein
MQQQQEMLFTLALGVAIVVFLVGAALIKF